MSQGFIYDQYGNHASKHQDGGVDEISVAGLSGLLADDQHVLDAEVLAYLLALTGAGANLKLFINAAGTAPEWSKGISVGSADYNIATPIGDVAYAGIGFKPSYILMLTNVPNTYGMSVGVGNVAAAYCIYNKSGGVMWPGLNLIVVFATENDYITAVIKSMDTDGFTIAYNKVNNPTGIATHIWMAFR